MSDAYKPAMEDIFSRLAALLQEGRTADAFELFAEVVRAYENDKARLQIELEQMKRRLFGRRSEKLASNQLAMFEQMLTAMEGANGVVEERNSAVDALSDEEATLIKEHRRRKRKGKTRIDLEGVPRKVIDVPLAPGELACPCCQGEREVIGFEETQTLERIAASFRLDITRRPKLACGNCKTGVEVKGDAPPKPIEGSIASAKLLADVVTSKYCYHLPLERLRNLYRNEGAELPLNVLVGWVAKVAEMLEPLAKRILSLSLAAGVLQTDDTRVTVLDRESTGGSKRGHFWAYLGDKKWLAFDYTPDWSAERPREVLAERRGWLQADGYKGYDALFNRDDAKAIEAGCWSHCRRGFVDALDSDKRAAEPIALIKQLFRVEELASAKSMTAQQRLELREGRSRPILKRLAIWLDKMRGRIPPKDPLGKAITYATNQWRALGRFLEDGRLEIDNNGAERALRAIAVGRKNWMFAGSDSGARSAAILYTIIGTARLANIDPRDYVGDVIQRLAEGWRSSCLDDLLPANWAASQAQKPAA